MDRIFVLSLAKKRPLPLSFPCGSFYRSTWCDLRLVLRGHGRHQLFDAYDVERPAKIIAERGKAELGPDPVEPFHQEGTLVHPLRDRAERMFDDLATLIENFRRRVQALLHAIERILVFEARDAAQVETTNGSFMTSSLPLAGFAVIEAANLAEAIDRVSLTPCAVAQGIVEVRPLEQAS